MDESGSTFTSSHTTFARLSLEARAYTAALPVLDHNIYHFPPTTNRSAEHSMFPHLSSHHDSSSTFITPDSGLSGKLEYRDHLEYFLYGAMIFMGLKKWKRALLFLEIVLMSPVVNNVSKIQVDAYKKWVLVNLLHKGHVSSAREPEMHHQTISDNLICSPRTCRRQQVNRLQSSITQSAKLMMDLQRFLKMASSTKSLSRDLSRKPLRVNHGGLR